MKLLEPTTKNAIIVTLFIFAQKIYRHPDDFSFIFNEGITTLLFGIIGMVMVFGGVCAFVFIALGAINVIIEKIKDTKIYNEYRYYILAFIILSVVSYFLTP